MDSLKEVMLPGLLLRKLINQSVAIKFIINIFVLTNKKLNTLNLKERKDVLLSSFHIKTIHIAGCRIGIFYKISCMPLLTSDSFFVKRDSNDNRYTKLNQQSLEIVAKVWET